MAINSLAADIKSKIRSGFAVNSFKECVLELVLNSLDAKSTAIAIRLNFTSYRIQIVDNGCGISYQNMNLVGVRYATSKCKSLQDLDQRPKCYGFRGEALASILSFSKKVNITSRTKESDKTYSKICNFGIWEIVELVRFRPSQGTTVTIEDFLYNMPVRRELLRPNLDLEEIRLIVERLAFIHPTVTFSLRDDVSGKIIYQSKRVETVAEALVSAYPDIKIDNLEQLQIKKNKVNVTGLIHKYPFSTNKLQIIYVNKRPIGNETIQKMVNKLFAKSSFHQRCVTVLDLNSNYAVYLLNISCPYSEVDIILDHTKTLVEFKKWDVVSKCIVKMVLMFLKQEDLLTKDYPDDPGDTKIYKEVPKKVLSNNINISEIDGAFRSRPVRRRKRETSQKKTSQSKKLKICNISNKSPCEENIQAQDEAPQLPEVPKTIFERHQNTQSLVLNSELEEEPKLEVIDTKTALADSQAKGKEILLDLFLKSSLLYRSESPKSIFNCVSMENFKRPELSIENVNKREDTTMTVSVQIKSHRTIVKSSLYTIRRAINDNNKKEAEVQTSEKFDDKRLIKNKRSKCLQTTLLEHQEEITTEDKREFELRVNFENTQENGNQNQMNFVPEMTLYDVFCRKFQNTSFDPHCGKYNTDFGNDFVERCCRNRKPVIFRNNFQGQIPDFFLKNEKCCYFNCCCSEIINEHVNNIHKSHTNRRRYCSCYLGQNFLLNPTKMNKSKNDEFWRNKHDLHRNNFLIRETDFQKMFQPHFDNTSKKEFRENCHGIHNNYGKPEEKLFNEKRLFENKNKSQRFNCKCRNHNPELCNHRNKINKNHEPGTKIFNNDYHEGELFLKQASNTYSYDSHVDYQQKEILTSDFPKDNFADKKQKINRQNHLEHIKLHKEGSKHFVMPNFSKNDVKIDNHRNYEDPKADILEIRSKTKIRKSEKDLKHKENFLFPQKNKEKYSKMKPLPIWSKPNNNEVQKMKEPEEKEIKSKSRRDKNHKSECSISVILKSNEDILFEDTLNDLDNNDIINSNNSHEDKIFSENTLIRSDDIIPDTIRQIGNPIRSSTPNKLLSKPTSQEKRPTDFFPEKMKKNDGIDRPFTLSLKKINSCPTSHSPKSFIFQNERKLSLPNFNEANEKKFKIFNEIKPEGQHLFTNKYEERKLSGDKELSPHFTFENQHTFTDQNFFRRSANRDGSNQIENCENRIEENNSNFEINIENKNQSDKVSNEELIITLNETMHKGVSDLLNRSDDINDNFSNKLSFLENIVTENIKNPVEQNDQKETTKKFDLRTGMTLCQKIQDADLFNFTKRIEFVPKGFSPILNFKTEVENELSQNSKNNLMQQIMKSYEEDLKEIKWEKLKNDIDFNTALDQIYIDKCVKYETIFPVLLPIGINQASSLKFSKDIFNELNIIGPMDKKFIVVYAKLQKIVIIVDQHAAHERVRLEKLFNEYRKQKGSEIVFKQKKLNKAILIKHSSENVSLLASEGIRNHFKYLGIVYNLNETEIEIVTIPNCIYNKLSEIKEESDRNKMLTILVSTLMSEELSFIQTSRCLRKTVPNFLINIINLEACRGAIKFGDVLTFDECEDLMKRLSECKLPFQCAHGRPTMVPLTNMSKLHQNRERRKVNFNNLKCKKCL